MAAPGRAGPFICDICGKEMPFRQISEHQRISHLEELREIQRANQDFGRRLLTIVVPATTVLLIGILVPSLVFHVHAPGWYFVVFFAGWIATLPAGWRYARKRTRAEFEMLGNRLYLCRICEVQVPQKDMRTHLGAEHPRELRYARISAYVVFGSLFGIVGVLFVYLAALFLDLLPSIPVDTLQIWVYGALVAWMGLLILWGTLVDPRLTAKARTAWRTTHLSNKGDQK